MTRGSVRGIVASLIGAAAAFFAIGVAAWLISDSVVLPGVSSLPFGLLVFAGVALLLSADKLVNPMASFMRWCFCRPVPDQDKNLIRKREQRLWHAMTLNECAAALEVAADSSSDGLSTEEATVLLVKAGENRLPKKPPRPMWRQLIKEVHEPQQTLLLVVAVLYALVGEVRKEM